VPTYEYACGDCHRKVSIFYRSLAAVPETPRCPQCGGQNLTRLMSRFWKHSARGSAIEQADEEAGVPIYGDPGMAEEAEDVQSPLDEFQDVAALARETRAFAGMMGEPLDAEFDAALRHIEQGADPDDVFGELDEAESEGERTENP
jgi:putative FmdB family regulatory protein